ncbi:MAG: DUF4177 domain-containing protein [Methanoregula sp.]|jgi:uncharacterized Zn finger protein (UPF0148 family)
MTKHFCDSCGAELIPGKEFCPKCLLRVAVVVPAGENAENKKQYPKDTPENRAKKMKEYKVTVFEEIANLSSRGKYDKTRLEDTLNSIGAEGWDLKKTMTRQIPGLASNTIEFIMIFERDMPLEP